MKLKKQNEIFNIIHVNSCTKNLFISVMLMFLGSINYSVCEFSLIAIFIKTHSNIFKVPIKLSHYNKFIGGIKNIFSKNMMFKTTSEGNFEVFFVSILTQ